MMMSNESVYDIDYDYVLRALTPAYNDYLLNEVKYFKSQLENGDRVLDAGCGSGRLLLELHSHVNRIIGVDNKEVQLESAKRNIKRNGKSNTNIFLKNLDLLNIDYYDKYFDKIVMGFSTIGSFGDYKVHLLNQLESVMKDSGKIMISAYAENAAEYQVELYSKLGINKLVKVTPEFVSAETAMGIKLVSERFTKNKLKFLAKEAGLKSKVSKLNEFTYMLEAYK